MQKGLKSQQHSSIEPSDEERRRKWGAGYAQAKTTTVYQIQTHQDLVFGLHVNAIIHRIA